MESPLKGATMCLSISPPDRLLRVGTTINSKYNDDVT